MNLPDRRPVVVALAGPHGAGKTTFCGAHLQAAALRFVNAEVLAAGLALDPVDGIRAADALRRELLAQRESFVFETVFADQDGEKLAFLQEAVRRGYTVLLCFIGLSSPAVAEQRVALRVSQGGPDVPSVRLHGSYRRTMANLQSALRELPHVLLFDNDDLATPFRRVAEFHDGAPTFLADPLPSWLVACT